MSQQRKKPDEGWIPTEDKNGYLYFYDGTNNKITLWAHVYISTYETPYVVSEGILTVNDNKYIIHEGYYKNNRKWTVTLECSKVGLCEQTDYQNVYTSNDKPPKKYTEDYKFTEEEKNKIKQDNTNMIRSKYPPELVNRILSAEPAVTAHSAATETSLTELLKKAGNNDENQSIRLCYEHSDNIEDCKTQLNSETCKKEASVLDKRKCAGIVSNDELKAIRSLNPSSDINEEHDQEYTKNYIKWFQKDARKKQCGEIYNCPSRSDESIEWDNDKSREKTLEKKIKDLNESIVNNSETQTEQDKIEKKKKENKLKEELERVKQKEQLLQQENCCNDRRSKSSPICQGYSTCSTGGGKTRRCNRTTRKGTKGTTRRRMTRKGLKTVGKRI